MNGKLLMGATCTSLAVASFSADAALIHQYSFGETGGDGTVLVDSVGGANGSIVNVGTNQGTVGGGQVTLAGGARTSSDYVQLGSNLLVGLTDATIEVWATPNAIQNWSRIFDFGIDTNETLFMSWTAGTEPGSGVGWYDQQVSLKIDLPPNTSYDLDTEYHIAMTIEAGGVGSNVTWYVDGALKGSFATNNT